MIKPESENSFRLMRRPGQITDAIVSITTAEKFFKERKIGEVKKFDTYQREAVLIYINDCLKEYKLRNSTHKLLDALMMFYSKNDGKELKIFMPLEDYMALCGLSDKKEARKRAKEDLELLSRIEINTGKNGTLRVIGSNFVEKGMVIAGLDSFFAPIYSSDKTFSLISPEIFRLSDKHNPNSYHLGRYVHVHKSRNIGKDNENIISVRSLLKACPNLATYEEIKKKGDWKYREKIIIPFERDMNALNKIFTWQYKEAGSDGKILTAEESAKLSYDEFIELNVVINWINYPKLALKS